MLNKKQLIDWFRLNGIDINVSLPDPLFKRLLQGAKRKDTILFMFMKDFFRNHTTPHHLILRFESWEELYTFYTHCAGSCSLLKA